MSKVFVKESEGIYRLKVPFEDLYTSVFLIANKQSYALVDCATYDSDVEEYILPALAEFGLRICDIKYLILTHNHGDHTGGLKRIKELMPKIEIVQKEEKLFERVYTYSLAGHTKDCIGVLDERTGTLISGDGLQGVGIGKYRCFLECKEEYLKTIEKIREDKRIKNVLFSHAYEPWNTDGAFSREEVEKRLHDCVECVEK